MGVQGLTVRLRPYANSVQWSTRHPSTDKIVIDGPSWAYWIYGRTLTSNTTASNAIEAIPSYAEVADRALAWLQGLKSFGLVVTHIFFDGILPKNKVEERNRRLDQYLRQLRSFREANSDGFGFSAHNASSRHPSRHSYGRSLPGAPFLVPAIIERLRESEFASITKVVPGESDAFCAKAANDDSDSIVFSNDSDLFVHCSKGRVVFFSDLNTSEGDVMGGVCFHPAEIASRFECDDFKVMAYAMSTDIHLTVQKAAEMIKMNGETLKRKANIWYDAMSISEQSPLIELAKSHNGLSKCLAFMDPRVSEMLHDWSRKIAIEKAESEVKVYLPFLIDDPTRMSPWRLSEKIRGAAYGILTLLFHRMPFLEVDRRGPRMKEYFGYIMPYQEVVWPQHLRDIRRTPSGALLPPEFTVSGWTKHFVRWALKEMRQEDLPQPELSTVMALCYDSKIETKWPIVYFRAQVEGIIYSMRMLQLVLDFFLNYKDAMDDFGLPLPGANTEDLEQLDAFYDNVQTLPPIRDMIPSPSESLNIEDEDISFREWLFIFYETTDYGYARANQLENGDYGHYSKRRKTTMKQKKERREAAAMLASASSGKDEEVTSNNPFNLLLGELVE